jgi:hypothetical protein
MTDETDGNSLAWLRNRLQELFRRSKENVAELDRIFRAPTQERLMHESLVRRLTREERDCRVELLAHVDGYDPDVLHDALRPMREEFSTPSPEPCEGVEPLWHAADWGIYQISRDSAADRESYAVRAEALLDTLEKAEHEVRLADVGEKLAVGYFLAWKTWWKSKDEAPHSDLWKAIVRYQQQWDRWRPAEWPNLHDFVFHVRFESNVCGCLLCLDEEPHPDYDRDE